jgi:transposase
MEEPGPPPNPRAARPPRFRVALLNDREALAALCVPGRPLTAVAALVGCCAKTVGKAVAAHGIARARPPKPAVAPPHRTRRPHPPQLADRAWLFRRYVAEGQTVRQIAAEVGSNRETVRQALHRLGIAPRPRGRRPTVAALADAAWLRARYVEDGWSSPRMARALGCHPRSVLDALVRHGIPRRPGGAIPRATAAASGSAAPA